MNNLPLELMNEIASYLNGVDLISFSMVNKDTSNLLRKRVLDEGDKV
jgi:hypothetical protein